MPQAPPVQEQGGQATNSPASVRSASGHPTNPPPTAAGTASWHPTNPPASGRSASGHPTNPPETTAGTASWEPTTGTASRHPVNHPSSEVGDALGYTTNLYPAAAGNAPRELFNVPAENRGFIRASKFFSSCSSRACIWASKS